MQFMRKLLSLMRKPVYYGSW